MSWLIVSNAAERSRRHRHDILRELIALMTDEVVKDIQRSRFSTVVLTVGRLVRT